MIVSAEQMRALEGAAFDRGITAEALMEQAGERCADAVIDFFPQPGTVVVVFGKGNNGGDALVAARHLGAAGWEVHVVPAFAAEEWNALVSKKFDECGLAAHHAPGSLETAVRERARKRGPIVLLDGLLGLGASGPLRGALADAARDLNAVRAATAAHVFALDLPTGLDSETGEPHEGCVVADFTLTIGAAKRGLIVDGAATYTGRLVLVPLDELSTSNANADQIATPANLARLLPRRAFEAHKGDAGRVAIVAGSRGMSGAALLCAEGALRGGAGLTRIFAHEDAYEIIATAAQPEVMVKPTTSYLEVLETPFDVLAIGPGLGQKQASEVLALIRRCEKPVVIDADGLNILSRDLSALKDAPAPRLLTPHPGEMKRLLPSSEKLTRAEAVRRFTDEHGVTLLLKGARTVVAEKGRPLSYNTAGNPGMATGGMGDGMTGVCSALLSQGLSTYDAARVGAWLCGRAAEKAVYGGGESEESLTARGVLGRLGHAFHALRESWV